MEETNYSQGYDDSALRLRDLEEKQNLLKDRIIIIGKNLIETKEETTEKLIELKKDIEILKVNVDKILTFLETLSAEIPKFAKKEDVDILYKQAKMFKSLEE